MCDSPLIGCFGHYACGLSSLVRGWYLCMRCVRSARKLAEEVCLPCWENSYTHLYVNNGVGETMAPEEWCTPIICAFSQFQEVCDGSRDLYGWS